jgi:hypothetical protein
MNTNETVRQPGQDVSTSRAKSGCDGRPLIQVLIFLSCILGAWVLLALGIFCGFGFLDSFEPGNGLAWKAVYAALGCGFLLGAIALVRCVMKCSAKPVSSGVGCARTLRTYALAALAMVLIGSAKSRAGSPDSPDPLLASGERALVGSYKLDDVLLSPGKLVVLTNSNPLFQDMGDTPEQAAQKGLLNETQLGVLKRQDCMMTILTNHSFVISNLPSTDLTRAFTVKGTWSMKVYHVFDTYGYRISLNCVGYKGPAIHARFINADKPDPPILEVFSGPGKQGTVMFRFANTDSYRAG